MDNYILQTESSDHLKKVSIHAKHTIADSLSYHNKGNQHDHSHRYITILWNQKDQRAT